MILQLDPPLPLVTPKGKGLAHFLLDYGAESHLLWVVFLDSDGSCWTVPNSEIRIEANWSIGRRPPPDGHPVSNGWANKAQTNGRG
ncbi:hypothetical protein [Falsiroseomonas sp. HW251]|uniref:hypothetical protein n=1 Tax=Falsiroseomonas sp. HW251 TaxID=3390998 RepID=UPI003D315CB4